MTDQTQTPAAVVADLDLDTLEKLARTVGDDAFDAGIPSDEAEQFMARVSPKVVLGLIQLARSAAPAPAVEPSAEKVATIDTQAFRDLMNAFLDLATPEKHDEAACDAAYRAIVDHIDAIAASRRSTGDAPEGYKLVPIVATPEMIRAGERSEGRSSMKNMESHSLIWRDMVAAAPVSAGQADKVAMTEDAGGKTFADYDRAIEVLMVLLRGAWAERDAAKAIVALPVSPPDGAMPDQLPVAIVSSRAGQDFIRVSWLRPEACNVGDHLYLAAQPAEGSAQVAIPLGISNYTDAEGNQRNSYRSPSGVGAGKC